MRTVKNMTLLFLATSLFFACSQNNKSEPAAVASVAPVSIDSLITKWNNAWNSKDSNAIADMLTSNTVVIDGSWKEIGKDSIMKNWVTNQLKKVTNLRTTKLTEGTSPDFAFQTGYYNLDVTRNDSVIGKAEGNYSMIWKRQSDNSMKVELMHTGDTK